MQLRRIWPWVIAASLMLAIPLSRLYLGVHFPVDLLGGYLLGALLLIVFHKAETRMDVMTGQKGYATQLAFALVLPAGMIFLSPSGGPTCISSGAALMGMGAGMILERRWVGFHSGGSWWKRLLRLVLGMAVSVAIWAGLKSAFASLDHETFYRVLRYGLLGFWATLCAPWVFYKLRLVDVAGPGVSRGIKRAGVPEAG